MSAPQPLPILLPYQRAMIARVSAHRWGKTHAMNQALRQLGQAAQGASRAFSGLQPVFVIHDELYHTKLPAFERLEPRDRSHFERGGRYRKPPAGQLAVAGQPGMVQVRNRRGELVWRQIGQGMTSATDATRMREHPLYGVF